MANDVAAMVPLDTPTTIGVAIVIGANIVISLALNIQKLAHRRIGTERRSPTPSPSPMPSARTNGHSKPARGRARTNSYTPRTAVIPELSGEREPLLSNANQRPLVHQAVTVLQQTPEDRPLPVAAILPRRSNSLSASGSRTKLVPKVKLVPKTSATPASTPGDDVIETAAILTVPVQPDHANIVTTDESSARSTPAQRASPVPSTPANEDVAANNGTGKGDYLRSKLWWAGFALMNVGEFFNFLSYAYAPASVVAPLGASALIANCFFSPLLLHERFRKRDILGIALTVLGAVTVVSAAKTSDVRLDRDALLAAIQQEVFVVYSAVCAVVVSFLVWLSERAPGEEYIAIDIGVCSLFGGYTVLSTKAFSTLLSMYGFIVFKFWIVYPIMVLLLGTGVLQIKYLNRALMRFDSKAVIPSQFIGFNLAAIVGSAILYRDFEDITFHRFLSFANGCAMTFLGVWVLAARATVISDEEDFDDDDDGRARTAEDRLEGGRDQSISRAQAIAAVSVPVSVTIRKKSSTTALGLSPGQHLLLATERDRIPRSARSETRDGSGSVSGRRRTIGHG